MEIEDAVRVTQCPQLINAVQHINQGIGLLSSCHTATAGERNTLRKEPKPCK